MPQQSLPPVIGFPFIELPSVESTNNYAMARVHAGMAQPGTAIFAHHQTAGKGQRGKVWTSTENENISMSLVLSPSFLPFSNPFKLSACVAVAAYQFFSKYAGEETTIKWPNDIYWRDRKAAGILIENVLGAEKTWKWSIVGIGININQTRFSNQLKNPVSLKQITGKNYEPVNLAKELCNSVNHYYSILQQGNFEVIHKLYNQVLYKRMQTVKFKKDNRLFEALVNKVTANGQLVIEHSVEEYLNAGEVEWL